MRGEADCEEKALYGRADDRRAEGRRGRGQGQRAMSQARISDATYYNWKTKYAGMSVAELRRLKGYYGLGEVTGNITVPTSA